ncbi:MAG: hypothetical protein AB2693_20525 [Candidatus Thiodiazotropha sp.]
MALRVLLLFLWEGLEYDLDDDLELDDFLLSRFLRSVFDFSCFIFVVLLVGDLDCDLDGDLELDLDGDLNFLIFFFFDLALTLFELVFSE